MNDMTAIIITSITSSGMLAFLQFLIGRHDKKKDEKDGLRAAVKDIQKKLKKQEKDSVRTQLLVLIFLQPHETQEILTLGKHYFDHLDGNWYMTSIYSKWLKRNEIEVPTWFNTQRSSETTVDTEVKP